MGSDRNREASSDEPVSIYREHLGLTITGLIFFWITIKVLAVANFRPVTAAAILSASGPEDVAIGTLMFLVPFLVMVAVPLYLFAPWPPKRLGEAGTYLAIEGLLGFGVLYLVPISIIGFAAVGASVGFLASWLQHRRKERRERIKRTMSFVGGWWIALVVWLFFFSGEMWLPGEVVTLDTGESVAGFVLEVGDRWTAVLLEDERTVAWYGSDAIVERTICIAPDQRQSRTLTDLIRPDPKPPLCSELTG